MKKKLVLKPFVLPTIYIIMVIALMSISTTMIYNNEEDTNITYVTDEIVDEILPVISTEEIYITKPYTSDKVTIATGYYNYLGDSTSQENSIIQYDNTYLQNSGVTYSADESFYILSIMEGKVTKVYHNDILGNIVEITHDKNMISIYQMLSEVNVKENQIVKSGELIGKSGKSELSVKENNLHLELLKDGIVVNPEDFIGKNIKEI